MRLAGIGMIWSGCVLWGILAAMELGRRTRLLESLVCALEQMERELTLRHLPLPELLEQLAGELTGSAAQLFETCGHLLEQEYGFTHAWAKAVAEMELLREERACLSELGLLLGRFDAEGQGEGINRVRRELERRAACARERQQTFGRIYGMLGITAGSVLAIVLL